MAVDFRELAIRLDRYADALENYAQWPDDSCQSIENDVQGAARVMQLWIVTVKAGLLKLRKADGFFDSVSNEAEQELIRPREKGQELRIS
jgi:hypothetical protein